MNPKEFIENHLDDRDNLLQQVADVLEEDDQVLSAWLWGSHVANQVDEFSDLDLWIVIPDGSIDEIKHKSRGFIRRIREPLIAYEVLNNAPILGHYCLSIYPGLIAPLHVDWIWQEIGAASRPPTSEYLIEGQNIPVSEKPPIFPGGRPRSYQGDIDRIEHMVRFFWAMLPVAIKKAVRPSQNLTSDLEMLILKPFLDVSKLLHVSPSMSSGFVPMERGSPSGALNHLRSLTAEMKLLMQLAEAKGAQVPSMQVVEQIEDHFKLADAKLHIEGAKNSNEPGT